ncbi:MULTISPECIES: hypothetical protein [unclassified Ruegeria]|uniref:hypothetical protein n=1 Tax=unclassified Ruegeria TaxID=2625375 RepID=UPI00148913E2|nr:MULTISPECIES: hypothetical protein [unclassified Ruegeria]NOD61865.1 hypothetical protein [Ruegeria sp. HKCCD6109]NOD92231.1 hypothetical protein [Ruegeria sp. HKCCD4884]
MVDIATFAYLPLISLILGGVAGLIAGLWIGVRGLFWLIGLTSAVALALIVLLAGVSTGEEEQAFGPFIWLTGSVLPFLLAVIVGGVGGRSLAKKSTT